MGGAPAGGAPSGKATLAALNATVSAAGFAGKPFVADPASDPVIHPVTPLTDRLAAVAQPGVDGMLETIRAMLDAADSLEAFQTLLAAAYPQLDGSALTADMAQAFAVAELAGMADVSDGD